MLLNVEATIPPGTSFLSVRAKLHTSDPGEFWRGGDPLLQGRAAEVNRRQEGPDEPTPERTRDQQLQILLATYTDLRTSSRHPTIVSVSLYSLLWLMFTALGVGFTRPTAARTRVCAEDGEMP